MREAPRQSWGSRRAPGCRSAPRPAQHDPPGGWQWGVAGPADGKGAAQGARYKAGGSVAGVAGLDGRACSRSDRRTVTGKAQGSGRDGAHIAAFAGRCGPRPFARAAIRGEGADGEALEQAGFRCIRLGQRIARAQADMANPGAVFRRKAGGEGGASSAQAAMAWPGPRRSWRGPAPLSDPSESDRRAPCPGARRVTSAGLSRRAGASSHGREAFPTGGAVEAVRQQQRKAGAPQRLPRSLPKVSHRNSIRAETCGSAMR